MTKNEYMKALSHQLRRLPKEDFDRALDYFEEYFADAGAENEEQAIHDLGTPEEAAKELITTLAAKNAEEPPKTVKRGLSAVWIGILGICAAPVALPLMLAVLLLVLAFLLVILMCLLTVFMLAFGLVLGGIGCIAGGAILFAQSAANGIATVGTGLICVGAGLLSGCAFFCIIRWLCTKLLKLLGRVAKGGKNS